MRKIARNILAALEPFRRPVRWVVLNEHFAVYDVARTERKLDRLVAELEAQGQEYTVEDIGARCRHCGEDVDLPFGYLHAPECPEVDA